MAMKRFFFRYKAFETQLLLHRSGLVDLVEDDVDVDVDGDVNRANHVVMTSTTLSFAPFAIARGP